MLEGGLIERWTNEFMPSLQCNHGNTLAARTYSMEDTAGVFIYLGVGIAVSLVVLVLEVVTSSIHNIILNRRIETIHREEKCQSTVACNES